MCAGDTYRPATFAAGGKIAGPRIAAQARPLAAVQAFQISISLLFNAFLLKRFINRIKLGPG